MIDASMQQFTFVAANAFEWREVPTPRIEAPGQAIVRPLAVARCDLDLYIANGAVPMKDTPFALGHEIAGEVVEVADDVVGFAPGDQVVVPFQINCGQCDPCLKGFTNACEAVPRFSAYGLAQSSGHEWGGGLSDYVRVPFAEAMLVKIPNGVSLPVAAAISDNASDGYRTVAHPLQENPGASVLIVGGWAQSIGLYAVQAAVALGASRVVYSDFDAGRLEQAKQMGAELLPRPADADVPVHAQFPIVVDASNLASGLIFALKSTAPCGVCTGISAPAATVDELPLRQMYMQGITYDLSRVHARAEIDAVLQCAHTGCIAHDDVQTRLVPFSEAGEAITAPDAKLVFVNEVT